MTISTEQTLSAMKLSAVFSALDDAALDRLRRDCRRRKVAAGEMILHAGSEAESFFLILSGRVKVFKLSARGDEQILHLYGPGETFGEAAAWAEVPFPAHAEALEATALLIVPRHVIRRQIAANPDLAMGMMAGLSAKLREFNKLIEELSLKEVPARLAGVLLAEAERAGSQSIRLRQTKRQLAAQIGTIAETLSRALGRLRAAGLIDVHGAKVTVKDPEALRDLAEHG